MRRVNLRSITLTVLAIVLAGRAVAESPAALMEALERLDTATPVSAQLESELWRAEGKGENREETTRAITISLADTAEGFTLQYGPDLLERLDEEAQRRVRDPDAKTPLNDFIWRLDMNQLRPLLSPAQALHRNLERARFREAAADEYNGRTATRLIFDRDKSVVHKRMRRYIKEFHSTLEVWVAPDGTPLASRLKLEAKGSILFVIRGEHREEVVNHYHVEDGRLIITEREEWQKTDLPGEHHESRLEQRLTLD
ncbi:hypothetical protein [Marinimicrobium agarilyticum]|uniref:hypothetical protein n=1 Tax=Marinimicrobium agarilyticum TaxID=306546 RepID=UPI0003FDC77F|nr:hypothetical protein [Marinimicrobium agarilyticum]